MIDLSEDGFPERPLYWAEFSDEADNIPATVSIIATWGWVLIRNEYEQLIYEAARDLMQKILAGEEPQHKADFVFSEVRATTVYFISQQMLDSQR